jgi:hypothetical protein
LRDKIVCKKLFYPSNLLTLRQATYNIDYGKG